MQGQFPFTVNITVVPLTDPFNWFHADGTFTTAPLTDYTGWHKPAALITNGVCQLGGVTSIKTQGVAHFHQP